MSWSTYFSQHACLKPIDPNDCYRPVARLRPPKAQSPYYPDREVAQKQKIEGSKQETQWKEVPSYHEQHSQTIESNLKKINII